MAKSLATHKDRLALAICDDAGKPIADAQAEVSRAILCFELAAAEALMKLGDDSVKKYLEQKAKKDPDPKLQLLAALTLEESAPGHPAHKTVLQRLKKKPTLEDQLQWPLWGMWHASSGRSGSKPDLPEANRLDELFAKWLVSVSDDERKAIWDEMLDLYTSQCFTLGLIDQVRQPLAVRQKLRNIPEEAIFNWEPQAQIGLYRPDTFFYAD